MDVACLSREAEVTVNKRISERLDQLAEQLRTARIVPVLRVPEASEAVRMIAGATAAGFFLVELTATIHRWQDALSEAARRWPSLVIGVGTVLNESDARQAIEGGADFLVSPYPVPAVRGVATEADVPFLEGGFTPAEIATAASRGIAKLYPAHVGGPTYLRSLLSVLPGARVVPTGGIGSQDVRAWLDAGALAVGIGRELLEGDAVTQLRRALEKSVE